MVRKLQYRRLLMVAVLLFVAFAGLGYRLVDLQVLQHDDLQTEARKNTEHTYDLEPRRGDIFDRRGNLLATSIFVKTVAADPVLIGTHQAEVAHDLAPLLNVSEEELTQRLYPRLRKNDKGDVITNRYVVLQRKVPMETWRKIQGVMTNFVRGADEGLQSKSERKFLHDLRTSAVFTDPIDDQLRTYPNQMLAAHVLGFVGVVEKTNAAGVMEPQTVGISGVESILNGKLSGIRGWRMTERDRRRREMVPMREQDVEAHDGLGVVLTIDSVVQHILETELAEAKKKEDPISVFGLIVRPKTGEILALANVPTFNPNDPGATTDALRDRVVSDFHEPGSTFKIVVISGALNDGLITLNDVFNCEHGHFAFGGRTLHDHAPYDNLTVEGIITKSSNIGAAKVGIKMGEDRLYQYMRNFGFGSRTGILLPAETEGMLHPVKDWSKVSIAQIPMGQGVAATALQMTMAMCAMANKGVLMRPMLVDRLQEPDGRVVAKYAPEAVRQVISESTANKMVQALKTVATKDGTAPKAAMEHYIVAGKTGTAQKPPYRLNKYYASFIGFFPADNPEVCIYIGMDEPKGALHQGGQIAAPVFKAVAEKVASYLNIRPDKIDEPAAQEVAGNAAATPRATMARAQ